MKYLSKLILIVLFSSSLQAPEWVPVSEMPAEPLTLVPSATEPVSAVPTRAVYTRSAPERFAPARSATPREDITHNYIVEGGACNLATLIDQADQAYYRLEETADALYMKIQVAKLKRLMQPFIGKRFVLLVGRTGIGKSTLLNLIKCNLRIVLDDDEDDELYFARINQEIGPCIGQDIDSETVMPCFHRIWQTVFVDTPGLLDNRGPGQRLLNILIMRELLRSKNTRICLFVEEDFNGIGLYKDLSYLRFLLRTVPSEHLARATTLVGSKFLTTDLGIFRHMLNHIAMLPTEDYADEKALLGQILQLGQLCLFPSASLGFDLQVCRDTIINTIKRTSYMNLLQVRTPIFLGLNTAKLIARIISSYGYGMAYQYVRQVASGETLQGLIRYSTSRKPPIIKVIEQEILAHDVTSFFKERYLEKARCDLDVVVSCARNIHIYREPNVGAVVGVIVIGGVIVGVLFLVVGGMLFYLSKATLSIIRSIDLHTLVKPVRGIFESLKTITVMSSMTP